MIAREIEAVPLPARRYQTFAKKAYRRLSRMKKSHPRHSFLSGRMSAIAQFLPVQ
ncbi:hypothetical protein amb1433 [Paramagnetospirillum magneticum AMB-1]|uniref:Uncharacterized protein n=1 Tax=Paramagnetospirillum magneticum (strain ATCC 700264 / AMB-1) TaxID=342108 RepID=Q2W7D8_PARM1|nr:hypothetical protein amb1433 [Paramagnetospirillum magneticum AMB-1]